MYQLFLTFDTEDFVSNNSVSGLHKLLSLLAIHDISAIFFITGHMAEKLSHFPNVVDLLNHHQIGYHSSSHSVHPTIFEFTDIENYEEAIQVSIQRETAHINPLTGEIEGKGGIYALQSLFRGKQVVAFRAPGYCWSPPHLEALRTLGINFDFSTVISKMPFCYKGIGFYPKSMYDDWDGAPDQYRHLFLYLRHLTDTLVLNIHPSKMVNKLDWDIIFNGNNPKTVSEPPEPHNELNEDEINSKFSAFNLLLTRLKILQRAGIIELTPPLVKTKKTIDPYQVDIEKCYSASMIWAFKYHKYTPKFLRSHFVSFFEQT
jgi:peptidoglycan/xylan/chitin deacetylase (PgdA/CDA1 family)